MNKEVYNHGLRGSVSDHIWSFWPLFQGMTVDRVMSRECDGRHRHPIVIPIYVDIDSWNEERV